MQFRQKRLCARGLVCAAMRRFAFGRAGGNIGSAFSSLWKMASTRAFPIRRVSRFVRGMFRALCGDACASRAETRFCWEDTPVMWFCRSVLRSITPALCRIAPNRTACGMFRSCSAVGRDRHSCVLESSVRLSGFLGSLRACAFFYGECGHTRKKSGAQLLPISPNTKKTA